MKVAAWLFRFHLLDFSYKIVSETVSYKRINRVSDTAYAMKNIVVLLLDTIRASDVHENPRLRTINYIARNGTTYMNAIAPGMWTAPSHASMFTERHVSEIKTVSKNFFSDGSHKIDPWMVKTKFLDDNTVTLAQKMHRFGYDTTLISSNPFLTSFTNLAVGFDKIYDVWLEANVKYNQSLVDKLSFIINGGAKARDRMYTTSYLMTSMLPKPILDKLYLILRRRLAEGIAKADGTYRLDRGAKDVNRALKRHIAGDRNSKPNFMFINYIEGHENYPISSRSGVVQDKWLYLSGIEEMTPDAMGKLHGAYTKRLNYLDDRVRDVLSMLKEKGMLEDASIVIASDHGQSFGEHGLLYHSLPPYQELAHVPLIIANYKNGKLVKAKEKIERPVSLLSLHGALLDLASGKDAYLNGNLRSGKYLVSEHTGICEGWDESLLRMFKSRSKSAALIYNAKSRFNGKATAVYGGNMKLMHYFGKRKDELYDLSTDPAESDNIIDRKRSAANDLLKHMPAS
jgi:arylsulfatase A-like enzyme